MASVESVRLDLPPDTLVLSHEGDHWVEAELFIHPDSGTITTVHVLNDKPDVAAAKKFLIPGLIDSHVHVTATSANLASLTRLHPSFVAVSAYRELRASVQRGFTTMRDAGGADCGLAKAAEEGLLGLCPRLLFAGRALSQTGGHGDFRGAHTTQ